MTSSLQSRQQDNLRGLLLMLGGFLAFSLSDTVAKVLTADYHPVQIVWLRQLGITTGVAILIATKGPAILRSVAPGLQIARGLCAIVSALAFVYALRFVPLADAVAVTFVAPFMVTVLGALLLGEQVGPRRWTAIAAGFVGMLIVIRPGLSVFHPAIFLVVLAASAFALRQILSRYLGNRDRTETTLAYTALTTIALLALPLPLVWQPIQPAHIPLLIGLAILAATGEILIIRALEIALAVVVAPAQYALILFSALWSYLVFDQLPDIWTWTGCAVIVGAGLYMLWRESLRKS